jgi:hypothetical protein
MKETVWTALASGIDYLLGCQAEDGHWEDCQLPTGASDAWVTAYVGLALLEVTGPGIFRGARTAAGQAARWLSLHRPYPAGWGYNGITGPDTDSTALGLRLLKGAGQLTHPGDEEWLRARWQPDGGFATYPGPAAWGVAHVDVAPDAYLALGAMGREELRDELITYLLHRRLPNGMWPAYWWRSNLYSTRACLALLVALDARDVLVQIVDGGTIAINSEFEMALALEIAVLSAGPQGIALELAKELTRRQLENGGWRGGDNLRVTDQKFYLPWERSEGKLYRDDRGLLTTATAVRALGHLT